MPAGASRFEVALLYISGVVQGLALVTFPAASSIFTAPAGFGLSSTQYGTMFIPQVLLAIGASAFGSGLARRYGLRTVLLLGLGGDVVSMGLLSASAALAGTSSTFGLLCFATGALGLGFGATVMALNTFVEGYFGDRADNAVLVLNALLGIGTALAPLLIATFTAFGVWWGLPVIMTALLLLLVSATLRAPLRLPYDSATTATALPTRFWIYAAAVTLYGALETLNGNWATLFLSEGGIADQDASFALTAFWVMVTVGRILVALLDRLVPARLIYVALPVLLAIAFQSASRVTGATEGVLAFSAAGLACSAFLPLTISFAGSEFPRQAAAMSGLLIAFYQAGYGVAAFGVGPARQLAGLRFATLFSGASLIAIVLAAIALLAVLPRKGRLAGQAGKT